MDKLVYQYGAADKSGEGEIQEFASEFQWRFFLRCHTELDNVRFVVRRVVVLGIARGRLNIRFGHWTVRQDNLKKNIAAKRW